MNLVVLVHDPNVSAPMFTQDQPSVTLLHPEHTLLGIFSSIEKAKESKEKYTQLKNVSDDSEFMIIDNLECKIDQSKEVQQLHLLEEQIEVNYRVVSKYMLIHEIREEVIKVIDEYYSLNDSNWSTIAMLVATVNLDELILEKINKSFIAKMESNGEFDGYV